MLLAFLTPLPKMGVGGCGGSSSCAVGSVSALLAWFPSEVGRAMLVSVLLLVSQPSRASLVKSDVVERSGPLMESFAAWTG